MGYTVKGTTTSDSKTEILTAKGIQPHTIRITEDGITGAIDAFLQSVQILIINIPPGLRRYPNKNHLQELRHLVVALERHHTIKNVLYVSSTSVFKDESHYPVISNNTRPNGSSHTAQQLISIEKMLTSHPNFTTTVLRCSGLVGNGRHPGNMLSGRKALSNGNAPVNLIHINDCIAVSIQLIRLNRWGVSYNIAYPYHPPKKDYYTNYCETHKIPVPEYNLETTSKGKLIDSLTVMHDLKITFKTKP